MARLPQPPHPTALRAQLAFSVLLAGVLLYTDHTFQTSHYLNKAASIALYPVHTVSAWPGELYAWSRDQFRTKEQWRAEQQKLERELLSARTLLHELLALEEENQRLRRLTELPVRSQLQHTLIAEVLTIHTGGFRRQIAINRGSYHDVYVGQPVLDTYGIVGQVSQVGLFQSTVLLVTDNAHAMLLQNQRTQEMFLAYGDQHQLLLPHVPWHSDLQVGDHLYTTGLDETFPDNFPVGVITEVIAKPELEFRQAHLRLAARLQHNREVLLAWPTRDPAP